jgi:hypothetical protein
MTIYQVREISTQKPLAHFTTNRIAQGSIDLSYAKIPEKKNEVEIIPLVIQDYHAIVVYSKCEHL